MIFLKVVGSTDSWKFRRANYKSLIKKRVKQCVVAKHFSDLCSNAKNLSKNVLFNLTDCLDNIKNKSNDQMDDSLLKR